MKKAFIIGVIITIANIFSFNLKAQSSSDIEIIGSFYDLKLYENESWDLNTGKYTPFTITGQVSNVIIGISADKSSRCLEVSFLHNMIIKQFNRVIKIKTFGDTGNSIFFDCLLDDHSVLSIQYQVNEEIAYIDYQNMDVVALECRCKWNELKKFCNLWY